MDRASRLLRRVFLFGALGIAFVGILLLRPSRTVSSPDESRLLPTFAPIDTAKVTALEIQRPAKAGAPAKPLRLARKDAMTWLVESAEGYPADAKKVEDFLRGLASVRTKSSPTSNPDKFGQFAGADGWTDVRIYEGSEAPSASFGIGKSGAEGSWTTVYLRVDDLSKGALALPANADGTAKPRPGKIVAATGIEAYGDKTDIVTWIDSRVFPGLSESEITEIEWDHAPKSFAGKLVKGTKGEKDDEDPWTLAGDKGGKAKAAEARLRTQQFAGMLLQSVAGKVKGDGAEHGLDKPDLVITATGRPLAPADLPPTWKIVVGKKVEGRSAWYARREGPLGKDPYLLTIGDSETSWFRSDPASLLETPPPPPTPPAEAGMDGAAMEGAAPAEGPGMEDGPAMTEPPAMSDAPAMSEEPAMGEPAMGETPAMGESGGMGEPKEAPPPGDK